MKSQLLHRMLLGGVVFCVVLFTSGCQKMYYSTMEAFGQPKRKLLVDRVEDARDAQEKTKEQFASALEQFSSVINFAGGDLEVKYEMLSDTLKKSKSRARAVKNRVDDVEEVAVALFAEWEEELEMYTSASLRSKSQRRMELTRRRYVELIEAMRSAEDRIDPVLDVFNDQVLFIKHNLNARAISSLKDELSNVEADVESLISEMEESIKRADAFISDMDSDAI